ncbi:MAG: nucleoside 2-deoxyribosyltransferase [Bacilli bacterium]|nr:nucleoside 2-deoxyribosyltransferase [Bacilli bacterium]
MKVFIASSFAYADPKISADRKRKIEEAASVLRARGFDVYVPHEHFIPDGENLPNHDWAMMVAEEDKTNILSSDAVVLLTYGKEKNNAGVAFESGFIAGANLTREKPIILVLVKMNDAVESLMMWSSSHIQVRGIESLKDLDFSSRSVLKDVILS